MFLARVWLETWPQKAVPPPLFSPPRVGPAQPLASGKEASTGRGWSGHWHWLSGVGWRGGISSNEEEVPKLAPSRGTPKVALWSQAWSPWRKGTHWRKASVRGGPPFPCWAVSGPDRDVEGEVWPVASPGLAAWHRNGLASEAPAIETALASGTGTRPSRPGSVGHGFIWEGHRHVLHGNAVHNGGEGVQVVGICGVS